MSKIAQGETLGNHEIVRTTGFYDRRNGQVVFNEIAQQTANHKSARTSGLYDRRDDQLTLDEVERILI